MKHYEVGENLLFTSDEPDGHTEFWCRVTAIHPDHVNAEGNGMRLYIDKDTEPMFKKEEEVWLG